MEHQAKTSGQQNNGFRCIIFDVRAHKCLGVWAVATNDGDRLCGNYLWPNEMGEIKSSS